MVTILKLYRLSICIILSTIVAGCSVFNDFYVINRSEKPTTVTINLSMPLEDLQKGNRNLLLTYADTVLRISDKTKYVLTKKLDYVLINPNKISIEIPSGATVLIGGATNNLLYADSIKFFNENYENIYSLESLSKHVSKSGGLFPPFQYTYTIERQ